MSGPRRIVLVSLHVPDPVADSAGIQYLDRLCEALHGAQVTVVGPAAPANQRAMKRPYECDRILISSELVRRGLRLRVAGAVRRLAPVAPPMGFARALIHDPRARSLLREADIIDLQWPVMAPLVPLMRRLAPNARVIVTLHDIVSQRYSREFRQRRTLRARTRAAFNYLHARVVEYSVVQRADTIVVFSDKDRQLLRNNERVVVVDPPLATPIDGATHVDAVRHLYAGSSPTAVLVGPLTRPENLDAARWLVECIWPRVTRAVPDARLLVVGRAEPHHRSLLSAAGGVEVAGFVEDLNSVYSSARAVLAPLRLGAGVKFKVIDALVRGIPVVATSVGVEGIGDAAYRPASYDNASDFANAVVRVLLHPDQEQKSAAEAAAWARRRYGRARFERRVAGLYGVAVEIPDGSPRPPSCGVSVVIPVRDGEHGIAIQLEALAAQREAGEVEVVVSDNGSTDRTVEVARAFRDCFQSLRIVDSGDRRGVSHARNVGAVAAQGQYVLFVDADDAIQPGYIAAMRAALQDADIVGGVAILHDGTTPLESAPTRGPLPIALGYLPYALGGVFGAHRSVLLALGGFDENFVGGHEEVDLAWRAQRAGYDLRGCDDAKLLYVQRGGWCSAFKQYRQYGRTSIQLWVRYAPSTPQLSPVSFKGSFLQVIPRVSGLVLTAMRGNPTVESARSLGWTYGTIEGHLRYRLKTRLLEFLRARPDCR